MNVFQRAPSTKVAATRPLAILFGDSITQFGFNTANDGWGLALTDYWNRKVDVLNRGFSGYNTDLAVKLLPEVVLPLEPNFVTIFFGANDAAREGLSKQHVPIERYIANIESMIYDTLSSSSSSSHPVSLILITPPPVHEDKLQEFSRNNGQPKSSWNARTNERTGQYAAAVVTLARKHGLPVIDLFTSMGGYDSDVSVREAFVIDGLHLNQRGNERLFQLLREVIEGKQQLLVVNEPSLVPPGTMAISNGEWHVSKLAMDQPHWSKAL